MLLKHDYILIVLILILIAVNNCDRFDNKKEKKQEKKEQEEKNKAAWAGLLPSGGQVANTPSFGQKAGINDNVITVVNGRLQYYPSFKDLTPDEIVLYTKGPISPKMVDDLYNLQESMTRYQMHNSMLPYMIFINDAGVKEFVYQEDPRYWGLRNTFKARVDKRT